MSKTYTKSDLQRVYLSDIYSFFDHLRKRPKFYLEQTVIEELIGFISGYTLPFSLSNSPKTKDNPWREFESFRYWLSTKDPELWQNHQAALTPIIKAIADQNNSSAYKQFWVEWDHFVVTNKEETTTN